MELDINSVAAAAVGLGGAVGAYVKSRYDFNKQEKRYEILKEEAEECHKNNEGMQRQIVTLQADNRSHLVEISKLLGSNETLIRLLQRK